MLIDNYLPNYLLREVDHIAVATSPSETFRSFCKFDMASVAWIRHLFQIRTLLDPGQRLQELTLRDSYLRGGFILLNEVEDQELVVGAIGKIWYPSIQFEHVKPHEFATFNKPGFGKVIWSLKCEPRTGGGTLITFELRIAATDASSSAKMRGYFSLIGPFSRAIRRASFKRISRQLTNLFEMEQIRKLPGDDLIEVPAGYETDGITIEAPPEAIWPWLVQMGCLRAGWYSYDWLDNGGIPSAKRILPEWQTIRMGDVFPATPKGDGKFFVTDMQSHQYLLLGGCVNTDTNETYPPDVKKLPSHYWRTTWCFVLEPQTNEVTRLLVRVRADFHPGGGYTTTLRKILAGQVHNFMEKKQLQNLKKRAEQMHRLSFSAA
jgi:hypothetical protein